MYSRETELRHLQAKDVYGLGVILDDNNCWKKLMEVIPKDLNTCETSTHGELNWDRAVCVAGLKYNNDHIRLIESASNRPSESRLCTQILFDEWSTSGRKHERPTVGVLLQLLIKAELFRAADFVAINFLSEPPPERPQSGPAARIDISLSDEIFQDIEGIINKSTNYPGTELLNDNVNTTKYLADNNKDYYTKFQNVEKRIDINEINIPTPPPRALRSARLQMQQQLQEQQQTTLTDRTDRDESNGLNSSINVVPYTQREELFKSIALSSENIPKFTALMTKSTHSIENDNDTLSQETDSTNLSEAPIPMISILADVHHDRLSKFPTSDTMNSVTESAVLPVIEALNLNDECNTNEVSQNNLVSPSHSAKSNSSSLSNNSANEDNEIPDRENENSDNSNPNLSISEQNSSNDDSSLTRVTGTSGDNSSDISTNDYSYASNENIPISVLNQ